ncbi:MAG: tetratricopeptide repeat protein, partial [Candidatus Nitrosopolaris sp.]
MTTRLNTTLPLNSDCIAIHTKKGDIMREVTIFQGLFLILCLITVIGLILLPTIFVLAKVQKDVASGNDTSVYNKGLALSDLGNYTGAIVYYDKALAINPHDVNALTHKGIALDNLGNYSGAIVYYDKALAINPKYEDALYNKGSTIDNLGVDQLMKYLYDNGFKVLTFKQLGYNTQTNTFYLK